MCSTVLVGCVSCRVLMSQTVGVFETLFEDTNYDTASCRMAKGALLLMHALSAIISCQYCTATTVSTANSIHLVDFRKRYVA